CGDAAYSEKVPDVDEGFTQADVNDAKRRQAIVKVIQARLQKAQQERPIGYLVRHAPTEDIRQLQQLTGHLQAGLFVTKFRKLFTRDEMAEDLVIVPARVGDHEDNSEYEEILPTSPPSAGRVRLRTGEEAWPSGAGRCRARAKSRRARFFRNKMAPGRLERIE